MDVIRNLAVCKTEILNEVARFVKPFLEYVLPTLKAKVQTEVMIRTQNGVLRFFFNFCQLSQKRQEYAVKAGLIPFLQHFVALNNPLVDMAAPMLFDLARCSIYVRHVWWNAGGLNTYLEQLDSRNYVVESFAGYCRMDCSAS